MGRSFLCTGSSSRRELREGLLYNTTLEQTPEKSEKLSQVEIQGDALQSTGRANADQGREEFSDFQKQIAKNLGWSLRQPEG